MKLTFPYMGAPAGYAKIATMLGHEVIPPPKPTQRTVDLGVKYSPEFACFPLKILLGTYIEAIEKGADTILSSGGHGPCRAGFYGEIQQKILKNMGYDVDFIIFDSFFKNPGGTLNNLKKLKGDNSWRCLADAVRTSYRAIKILDQMERQIQTCRAYEAQKGASTRAWNEIQSMVDHANDLISLEKVRTEAQSVINGIKQIVIPETEKIRIGIIGEIYVVMESAVNMKMEERLGELGCEVRRSQHLSDYVDFHLIPHRISHPHEVLVRKKGTEYFGVGIGGHARENMGWIAEFKERGMDGIVHLLPFACLPELMSQSIIPAMSHNLDIPVLSLSLDEQTGRANILTRVEAFVDLLKARKIGKIRKEVV